MTELILRPYQQRAVDATFRGWAEEGLQRLAGITPTGGGKTVMFSAIGRIAIERGCPRVGVLAHRDELIEQAVSKLRSAAPDHRVGVIAGKRNDVSARIVVASVQTLARGKRLDMLRNVGLWIVDEAHHAVAATYMRILTAAGCFEPGGAKALGVTATMFRSDRGKLGDVWQRLAFEIGIMRLIRDGYLVKPRGVHVRVENLDLDKVKMNRGDFSDGDMGRAMGDSLAPQRIVEAIQEHADGRKGILFGPTVAFAELMAQRLNEAGVPAAAVSGTTPTDVRRDLVRRLGTGELRWLTNCGVFTEGTDIPSISVVCVARPTKSAGLFTQMVGRGLRPFPGKIDCVVLDVVGVTKRHKLAGLASLAKTEDVIEKATTADDDLDDESMELEGLLGYDDEEGAGSVEAELGEDVRGRLVAEFVDLFDSSHSAWLQTNGGTWFLPVGRDFIAIVPDRWHRTGWAVVRLKPDHGASEPIARCVEEISYAMAYGEQAVTAAEMMYVVKDKAWRKGKPSQAQLDLAARWGIVDVVGRRGELSDALSIATASARIDPYIDATERYI